MMLIWIPFIGTALGAGLSLFMKKPLKEMIQKALLGFAAGVMVAASIWSLMLPSLETGGLTASVLGFWLGILFLLFLDHVIPHLHGKQDEGPRSKLKKTTKMMMAVTIHNIPEGMAVGIVYAAMLQKGDTLAAPLALALGIAIQNLPEGAIISIPLRNEGMGRWKAFGLGALSGFVEPVASIVTMMVASMVGPYIPYFLSFAAGAMLYVVVEELIPEMATENHSNLGTLCFAFGFTAMIMMDVLLG